MRCCPPDWYPSGAAQLPSLGPAAGPAYQSLARGATRSSGEGGASKASLCTDDEWSPRMPDRVQRSAGQSMAERRANDGL
eukprot:5457944-Alexandrium_andersonii.AAC.1